MCCIKYCLTLGSSLTETCRYTKSIGAWNCSIVHYGGLHFQSRGGKKILSGFSLIKEDLCDRTQSNLIHMFQAFFVSMVTSTETLLKCKYFLFYTPYIFQNFMLKSFMSCTLRCDILHSRTNSQKKLWGVINTINYAAPFVMLVTGPRCGTGQSSVLVVTPACPASL